MSSISELKCAANNVEACAQRDVFYYSYLPVPVLANRVRIIPYLCGEYCAARVGVILGNDLNAGSDWVCHNNLFGFCQRTLRAKEYDLQSQTWGSADARPMYRVNFGGGAGDPSGGADHCKDCVGTWLRDLDSFELGALPGGNQAKGYGHLPAV